MSTLQITVLPVGQGTGTLIQRFDVQGQPPTSTVLVDLGQAWWACSETGPPSINFIANKLNEWPPAKLNAVFLSHGDIDHVSLIGGLLKKFSPPTAPVPGVPVLTIEQVFYGGPEESYVINNVNYLDLLNGYRPPGEEILNGVGLNAGGLRRPYFRDNDLYIYVLAGNVVSGSTEIGRGTPLQRSSKNYAANTDSLVLLVDFGAMQCQYAVLPGDATGFSLALCCERLAHAGLPPVAFLSAPHHGSSRTTFNLLGAQIDADWPPDDLAQENVDYFNDLIRPQALVVSAGEVSNYRMPRSRAINAFSKYVTASPFEDEALRGSGKHFYTCFLEEGELIGRTWPENNGWRTMRTGKAVYTTDYFAGSPATTKVPEGIPPSVAWPHLSPPPFQPPPPRCCGWRFDFVEDAGFSVQPILDLNFRTAAHKQGRAAEQWPLSSPHFVFLPSAPGYEAPPAALRQPAEIPAAAAYGRPADRATGRSSRLRPLM